MQAAIDALGWHGDLSEKFSRQRMHDAGVVLIATNPLGFHGRLSTLVLGLGLER